MVAQCLKSSVRKQQPVFRCPVVDVDKHTAASFRVFHEDDGTRERLGCAAVSALGL